MTAAEARELLAACKRQRDVWRIAGMPPSPEAVARVERDEAVAHAAIVEDYDRDHNARVAAEAEADGLRRDLAAVRKARDEAVANACDALERAAGLAARHADLLTTARGLAETGDVMLRRMTAAESERDLYRAALADAARGEVSYCGECERLATARGDDRAQCYFACDLHRGEYEWTDTPHAAAIRGALKATEGER